MREPYYSDGAVTLWHGDCREVTAWLDADVLVTDPPYGMAFVSGARKVSAVAAPIAGDRDTTVRDTVLTLWGGARPAIVFGTWRVPPPAAERIRLVWWKRGGGPGMGDLSMPWGTSHEEIYVLGNGWDREATGQIRAASVMTTDTAPGNPHGAAAKYGHPTPKPISVMEQLLVRCPPGVIADPFAGSGSTLVAARNLGRRAVGVELEERYCETVALRLAQDVLDFTAYGP